MSMAVSQNERRRQRPANSSSIPQQARSFISYDELTYYSDEEFEDFELVISDYDDDDDNDDGDGDHDNGEGERQVATKVQSRQNSIRNRSLPRQQQQQWHQTQQHEQPMEVVGVSDEEEIIEEVIVNSSDDEHILIEIDDDDEHDDDDDDVDLSHSDQSSAYEPTSAFDLNRPGRVPPMRSNGDPDDDSSVDNAEFDSFMLSLPDQENLRMSCITITDFPEDYSQSHSARSLYDTPVSGAARTSSDDDDSIMNRDERDREILRQHYRRARRRSSMSSTGSGRRRMSSFNSLQSASGGDGSGRSLQSHTKPPLAQGSISTNADVYANVTVSNSANATPPTPGVIIHAKNLDDSNSSGLSISNHSGEAVYGVGTPASPRGTGVAASANGTGSFRGTQNSSFRSINSAGSGGSKRQLGRRPHSPPQTALERARDSSRSKNRSLSSIEGLKLRPASLGTSNHSTATDAAISPLPPSSKKAVINRMAMQQQMAMMGGKSPTRRYRTLSAPFAANQHSSMADSDASATTMSYEKLQSMLPPTSPPFQRKKLAVAVGGTGAGRIDGNHSQPTTNLSVQLDDDEGAAEGTGDDNVNDDDKDHHNTAEDFAALQSRFGQRVPRKSRRASLGRPSMIMLEAVTEADQSNDEVSNDDVDISSVEDDDDDDNGSKDKHKHKDNNTEDKTDTGHSNIDNKNENDGDVVPETLPMDVDQIRVSNSEETDQDGEKMNEEIDHFVEYEVGYNDDDDGDDEGENDGGGGTDRNSSRSERRRNKKAANDDTDKVKNSPKKTKKRRQRKNKASTKKKDAATPQSSVELSLENSVPQSPSYDTSGDDAGFASTDDDIETAEGDLDAKTKTSINSGNNDNNNDDDNSNSNNRKKSNDSANVNNKKKQKKQNKRKNKKSDKGDPSTPDDDTSKAKNKPLVPPTAAIVADSVVAGLPPSAQVSPVGEQKDIVVPLTKSPKRTGGKKSSRRSKSPGRLKNSTVRARLETIPNDDFDLSYRSAGSTIRGTAAGTPPLSPKSPKPSSKQKGRKQKTKGLGATTPKSPSKLKAKKLKLKVPVPTTTMPASESSPGGNSAKGSVDKTDQNSTDGTPNSSDNPLLDHLSGQSTDEADDIQNEVANDAEPQTPLQPQAVTASKSTLQTIGGPDLEVSHSKTPCGDEEKANNDKQQNQSETGSTGADPSLSLATTDEQKKRTRRASAPTAAMQESAVATIQTSRTAPPSRENSLNSGSGRPRASTSNQLPSFYKKALKKWNVDVPAGAAPGSRDSSEGQDTEGVLGAAPRIPSLLHDGVGKRPGDHSLTKQKVALTRRSFDELGISPLLHGRRRIGAGVAATAISSLPSAASLMDKGDEAQAPTMPTRRSSDPALSNSASVAVTTGVGVDGLQRRTRNVKGSLNNLLTDLKVKNSSIANNETWLSSANSEGSSSISISTAATSTQATITDIDALTDSNKSVPFEKETTEEEEEALLKGEDLLLVGTDIAKDAASAKIPQKVPSNDDVVENNKNINEDDDDNNNKDNNKDISFDSAVSQGNPSTADDDKANSESTDLRNRKQPAVFKRSLNSFMEIRNRFELKRMSSAMNTHAAVWDVGIDSSEEMKVDDGEDGEKSKGGKTDKDIGNDNDNDSADMSKKSKAQTVSASKPDEKEQHDTLPASVPPRLLSIPSGDVLLDDGDDDDVVDVMAEGTLPAPVPATETTTKQEVKNETGLEIPPIGNEKTVKKEDTDDVYGKLETQIAAVAAAIAAAATAKTTATATKNATGAAASPSSASRERAKIPTEIRLDNLEVPPLSPWLRKRRQKLSATTPVSDAAVMTTPTPTPTVTSASTSTSADGKEEEQHKIALFKDEQPKDVERKTSSTIMDDKKQKEDPVVTAPSSASNETKPAPKPTTTATAATTVTTTVSTMTDKQTQTSPIMQTTKKPPKTKGDNLSSHKEQQQQQQQKLSTPPLSPRKHQPEQSVVSAKVKDKLPSTSAATTKATNKKETTTQGKQQNSKQLEQLVGPSAAATAAAAASGTNSTTTNTTASTTTTMTTATALSSSVLVSSKDKQHPATTAAAAAAAMTSKEITEKGKYVGGMGKSSSSHKKEPAKVSTTASKKSKNETAGGDKDSEIRPGSSSSSKSSGQVGNQNPRTKSRRGSRSSNDGSVGQKKGARQTNKVPGTTTTTSATTTTKGDANVAAADSSGSPSKPSNRPRSSSASRRRSRAVAPDTAVADRKGQDKKKEAEKQRTTTTKDDDGTDGGSNEADDNQSRGSARKSRGRRRTAGTGGGKTRRESRSRSNSKRSDRKTKVASGPNPTPPDAPAASATPPVPPPAPMQTEGSDSSGRSAKTTPGGKKSNKQHGNKGGTGGPAPARAHPGKPKRTMSDGSNSCDPGLAAPISKNPTRRRSSWNNSGRYKYGSPKNLLPKKANNRQAADSQAAKNNNNNRTSQLKSGSSHDQPKKKDNATKARPVSPKRVRSNETRPAVPQVPPRSPRPSHPASAPTPIPIPQGTSGLQPRNRPASPRRIRSNEIRPAVPTASARAPASGPAPAPAPRRTPSPAPVSAPISREQMHSRTNNNGNDDDIFRSPKTERDKLSMFQKAVAHLNSVHSAPNTPLFSGRGKRGSAFGNNKSERGRSRTAYASLSTDDEDSDGSTNGSTRSERRGRRMSGGILPKRRRSRSAGANRRASLPISSHSTRGNNSSSSSNNNNNNNGSGNNGNSSSHHRRLSQFSALIGQRPTDRR